MNKFLNKETAFMAVVVFLMIVQSNYFATKLDLAKLQNEMLRIQAEVKEYSDKHQQTITETIKTGIDLLYKTHIIKT